MKQITFIIIFVLLLSGCATLPKRPPSLRIGLESQVRYIQGKKYIGLAKIARYYDMDWELDPFFQKIVLVKEHNKLIFALNSSYALLNQNNFYLGGKVIIHQGEIMIPYDGMKKIITYLYYRKYKAAEFEIKRRYRIRRIVIDPGHGGKDPGAIGKYGLKEKDVVLDVARILKTLLEKEGYRVILTRNSDRFLSLWRRTYIANRAHADLFISIHANSSRDHRATGHEVYYLAEANDDYARALAAAENYPLYLEEREDIASDISLRATIWDLIINENREESIALAHEISKALAHHSSDKVRGVKSAKFYVLKGVNMPAVLIEIGFISNPYYEKLMRTHKFKRRIAEAILRGIKEYDQRYYYSER